jgi:hypothetical protein
VTRASCSSSRRRWPRKPSTSSRPRSRRARIGCASRCTRGIRWTDPLAFVARAFCPVSDDPPSSSDLPASSA